jgi:hypothetical protein
VKLEPRVLTYKDEVLADGSVRRSFSDGNYEWRRRQSDWLVEWQDSQGYSGVDELLGDGIIKRTLSNGRVFYAREQGYGRTLWYGGRVLTINQTSFGGRMGMILASLGAGFLLGSLVPPPDFLTPEEEEMLRQKLREQMAGSTSTGSTGGSSSGDSDDDSYDYESQYDPVVVEQDADIDSGDLTDDLDIGDFG